MRSRRSNKIRCQSPIVVVVAAAAAVVVVVVVKADVEPGVPAVGSGWKLSRRSKQNNKLITGL